jgi:phosphopantetheinyl transferase (holo-ACP synthase)
MINTFPSAIPPFSAIIVSNKALELISNYSAKNNSYADKFVDQEYSYLDKNDLESYIKKLTVIWGVKEAILKSETKRNQF